MARRKRFSKPLVYVMGLALVVGSTAVIYKMIGGDDTRKESNNVRFADAPATQPTKPKPVSLSSVTPTPATQPIKIATPTTKPAILPAMIEPKSGPTPAITLTPPAPVSFTGNVAALIADADAKQKADDLVAARNLLVQAIDTRKLSPAEHDDVLRRLNEINGTVVFSNRKFNSDTYAIQHTVKPGELMTKIAQQYDVTWKFIGRLNGISDPRKLQAGKSLKIIRGPFHALVNKTTFTLDIYLGKPSETGSIFLRRFRVGLGENDSTPTGEWTVDTKLENPRYFNPRSDGPRVIEPDDPKNPLGERWIALVGTSGQAVGKSSYGIHGTIDPASIGQKKSMGCIRMLNEDVELVYDMLIPGKSTVTVAE